MTQSIDQLHLLILNVGLAIHNADWNWKNVSSPFTRLYYIMEGTAQIIFPDGMQELKPHHLYLVPSFTTHSYQCNSHFTHYYLHIYEDHQSESGILEDWNFPIEIPAGNLELPLIKRLCEINPTMQEPHVGRVSPLKGGGIDNDRYSLIQNNPDNQSVSRHSDNNGRS